MTTLQILQPGDLVADRFRVERQVGRGGMGTVYRALDTESGDTPLALKVLHDLEPSSVARFHREASLLSRLVHPAIVCYVAHGLTPGGNPFLAMEWLEGEDLAARLKRGPLMPGEVAALARRVGSALGLAHGMGVVHRDLKPGNIFLERGEVRRARVLDFGVALARTATLTLTATADVVGTPFYLAPEQARGAHHVTPRADVFSLGCVLFECLTGRKAFDGDSVLAVLAAIMVCENPFRGKHFPGVSDKIRGWVSRMLAKEPDRRPADGSAVVELFKACVISGEADDEHPGPATSLSVREQKLVTVIAGKPARPTPGAALDAGLVRSLEQSARTFGARWESRPDGTVLLTLTGSELARDQACQAVRCAVNLRDAFGGGELVVTTGNTEMDGATPTGPLTERYAEMLRTVRTDPDTTRGAIYLDGATAGLVRGHFEIREQGGWMTLDEGASEAVPARRLLGRPTPFVGRERELGTLRGLLAESTADGVARVALVIAEPGMGKSRLVSEFLAEVRRAGDVFVLTARGDRISLGAPFFLLREMIRGAVGLQPGEPDAEGLRKLDRFLGRVLSGEPRDRVSHFFAPMLGLPAVARPRAHLPSGELNPRALGDQLRQAVEVWLAAECADHNVLVVLEDLHWGDVPTVHCLDAVLRNLSESSLFVLATARPEVHDLFPGLWAARGVQEIRLASLSRRATDRLVSEAMGPSTPEEVRARIVARSAGSPFFVEELVRAFRDDPALTLPGSVVAMVLSRLERLPVEARRVLRAAAVFGQVFWQGGVAHLLGPDWRVGDVEAWLSRLVDEEVVAAVPQSRFPPGKEYEFRHAVMQEAAYGMLTAPDRALGHRLAAGWLEQAGERNSRVLAEHHERGGEAGPAAGLYRQAAGQALEGNDLEGTLHCVQRAIALGAGGELKGEVHVLEAEALDWLGRMDEAIRAGFDALALLPRYGTGWLRAAGLVAEAAGTQGDLDTVEVMTTELVGAVRNTPPNAELVQACTQAAVKLLLGGRPQAAEPLLRSVQGRMIPDDPLLRAWLERWLGFKCLVQGDSAGFLVLMEQSAEHFALAGDLRNACLQRGNAGWAYGDLGAYDDARQVLTRALASAEKLGLEGVAASVRTDLVPVLACLGLTDEALEAGALAARAAAGQGELRMEAIARLHRALMLLQRGERAEADAEINRSLACAEQILPTRAYALAVKARVLLAGGDPAAALETARQGIGILRELRALDAGESFLRLVHADALAACGFHGEAEAFIGAAQEKLRERAERIVDPQWRRSFLERVPENHRTMTWVPCPADPPSPSPEQA
ncbi:MAG: protein kinase [Acidobacteria bacterium]|nr:protein kinase [Acidobacteriota bacterium]